MQARRIIVYAPMAGSSPISAEVDFGDVAGYFVLIDLEIPRDALYRSARDDGGPMGYLVLTAEEADRFAAQLQERAERVRGLSAQLP